MDKINVIYATITGSKLYGIDTEESDTDFKGIAFPTRSQLIGLENFEQQKYSNGVEDGPEKVEGEAWAFKKFINLCMKGNPTVIEIAFADPKFHIHSTPIGLEIMKFVRDNMLTKHLFKPYSAYHRAQIRKLQSKQRVGKRKAIVDEHGYDCKFAGHAYRLARQCCIVMREGTLRPTLDPEDRELALKIRAGKENFTMEEVLQLLEEVDKDMYVAYNESKLPEKPDFDKVNQFVQFTHSCYLRSVFDDQFKDFNVPTA